MLPVHGECLLVRIDRRPGVLPKATAMNSTAAAYWEMLEEELDTREMLGRMRERCKPDSVISEAGLNEFLSQLEAVGAIKKIYK